MHGRSTRTATVPGIIRERRAAAGMTQRQLAEAVGAWPAQISDWERGRHAPGVAVAARLAATLGGDVLEYLGLS